MVLVVLELSCVDFTTRPGKRAVAILLVLGIFARIRSSIIKMILSGSGPNVLLPVSVIPRPASPGKLTLSVLDTFFKMANVRVTVRASVTAVTMALVVFPQSLVTPAIFIHLDSLAVLFAFQPLAVVGVS